MAGCNEEKCNCPKTTCERHGKCCECVNFHRQPEIGSIPFCVRAKANELAAQREKAGA